MTEQLTGNFVMIIGVAKCGSTSLFEHLSTHPQVLSSYEKGCNYFLYPDPLGSKIYPSQWESKYLTTPIEDYYKAFPPLQNKDDYRLDGSVRYWWTEETCKNIHAHIPKAKLIFIFRNPVDRLISIYRYQKQMFRIPSDLTIEQYVHDRNGHNQAKRSTLTSGKYADRLRPYWERFDHDNILLLGFSELKNNPLELMQKICNFLNIDDQAYVDYEFAHHNKTQSVKNTTLDHLQFNIIMPIYRRIMIYPKLFNIIKVINRRTWYPLYQYLNGKSFDKSKISAEVRDYLTDYYKDEARVLFELTGVDGLLD